MTNWIWLKELKYYLNMALVTRVEVGDGVVFVNFCDLSGSRIVLTGQDAEQLLDYLKRQAYC